MVQQYKPDDLFLPLPGLAAKRDLRNAAFRELELNVFESECVHLVTLVMLKYQDLQILSWQRFVELA